MLKCEIDIFFIWILFLKRKKSFKTIFGMKRKDILDQSFKIKFLIDKFNTIFSINFLYLSLEFRSMQQERPDHEFLYASNSRLKVPNIDQVF